MPAVVERISRLEEAVERFVEQSAAVFAAAAAIREDVAEIRASNARTDRALLQLRQESEKRWKESDERWKEFEQRAEKDRKESDERWKKSDERWKEFERQAEKDRKESEARRKESEERRKEAEERWKKFEQQAEKDRKESEERRKEADKDRKDFNKRMAELSDRIGRFVEDMVHPNAVRIAGKLFGDDPIETLAIRVKRRHPADASRMMELDLLVVGEKHLLVGEAKSTPTVEKADAFLEKVREVPDFFPEYADRTILPLLASVSFDPSLVTYLSRQRLYALGFGDETMELLNEGAF